MEEKIIKTKKPKIDYIYALGRKKTATARVRFYPEQKGEVEVNGIRIEEYFPGKENQSEYTEALRTCNLIGKNKITVKVDGSGKKAQLGAIIHGISRCLNKFDSEKFHPILKKRGFLTRDPRVKERHKVGMGGKARRKRQSPRR